MQGVQLCSSMDQGKSPRANWSVWLEASSGLGSAWRDPSREAAGMRKSGCRFSFFLGPRGGQRKNQGQN